MIVMTGGLISGILGVCMGNTLWLAGLLIFLIGIWGIKVTEESIMKTVRTLSLMTGGEPQGFALKLKGLVDPTDRTNEFGRRMLIIGTILLIVGGAFISNCAG